MSTDPDDFLLGGGGKSARFETTGDTVTGQVVSTEVRQQTDISTGSPLTWDNGDPRQQLVVTLATTIREDGDDDGHRVLYVKGSKAPGSKSLHDAVRAAVQNAGAGGLQVGGTLTVRYVGDEPSKTRGFSPRKLYEATYTAPDKAAESAQYLGAEEPAPAAAAPAPAPAAAAAPAASSDSPAAKARQLIAVGVDDATIAAATGLDVGVVAAIRSAAA